MLRRFLLLAIAAAWITALPGLAQAQSSQEPPDLRSQDPPRSDDRTPSESSSKDTRIDLSPPAGDAKMHPNSGVADDVLEMRPWDPHRAEKNIEVGDYYLKRKNYQAAESRYREALLYKDNDAEATYKLAFVLDYLGTKDEALSYYESYLKILPGGPHALESRAAIERIKNPQTAKADPPKKEKKKKEKSE